MPHRMSFLRCHYFNRNGDGCCWSASPDQLCSRLHAGNPVTDPKFDQQGGLDFWTTHGLITQETRHAVMTHCNMTTEPLGRFCGGPRAAGDDALSGKPC